MNQIRVIFPLSYTFIFPFFFFFCFSQLLSGRTLNSTNANRIVLEIPSTSLQLNISNLQIEIMENTNRISTPQHFLDLIFIIIATIRSRRKNLIFSVVYHLIFVYFTLQLSEPFFLFFPPPPHLHNLISVFFFWLYSISFISEWLFF